MKPNPLFPLPQHLPPKTAMALFDLLSELTNALWQLYEPELVELIVQELKHDLASEPHFDPNQELTF